MVKPVDRIVPDFAKAGAAIISFHPEASEHVDRTIALIHDSGCKAGLVLNPATPVNCLDHVLDKLDLVLIMSVNPGFGGQSFIPEALNKLALVRARIDESTGAHGPRDPARSRRRRQNRQHRGHRQGRRRHVRRRLGDFRDEGLRRDHRRDARGGWSRVVLVFAVAAMV